MNDPDWSRRPPLIYVSFFLELPFDVGLTGGQAVRRLDVADGPLAEWSDLDLDAFLSMPPVEEPGTFPCTALYFRRATSEAPDPLTRIAAAFPENFPGPGGPVWRRLLRRFVPRPRAHTIKDSRTVVAAVRIAVHDSGVFGSQWLGRQFEIALGCLNEQLLALGVVASNLKITAVTPIELPPMVGGFHADFRDNLPLKMQPFALLVHPNVPHEGADLPPDVIEHAMDIVGSPRELRPFFPALELSVAAKRSFLAARLRHAVLESGTAIELMLHTAVREVGNSEDWSSEKLENVARSFKNLVEHHVAPMFGFSPALESAGDALACWWQEGYKLRNRVAHEGHEPTINEAVAALRAADELSDALGLALSKHVHTRERFPEDAIPRAPSIEHLFRAGDLEAVEAALREDMSLEPGLRAFNLGVTLLRRGRQAEAEAAFRDAVESSEHPGAALNLGSFCLARGDLDAAEGFYRLAADSLHPKHAPRASLELARLLANRTPTDAELYYRRALASDEEAVVPTACFELGGLLEETGRLVEAERLWEQGMNLGDGRSAVNLANHRQAREDWTGAEQALRSALADDDVRPRAAFNLGVLLFDQGRIDDGLEHFEVASKLGSGRAALTLAGHYHERGDVAGCRRQLERAAQSQEEDVARAARELLSDITGDA